MREARAVFSCPAAKCAGAGSMGDEEQEKKLGERNMKACLARDRVILVLTVLINTTRPTTGPEYMRATILVIRRPLALAGCSVPNLTLQFQHLKSDLLQLVS